MDFRGEAEIVETYLPENMLTPLDQAIEDVMRIRRLGEYEVVSGDTLSEISIKVNIPIDQIIAMNSETLTDENSTIRVGDKLIITVPEPELSVERMEQNYYEEIYDADVIYVDNDSWYTTQTKILQQPSAGFRRVVADVSYLNDREVTGYPERRSSHGGSSQDRRMGTKDSLHLSNRSPAFVSRRIWTRNHRPRVP